MSERLIDYLCGSIDEVERAALESLLLDDAELARQLEILRRAVAWLEELSEAALPPAELAERTHRRIFPSPDGCRPPVARSETENRSPPHP